MHVARITLVAWMLSALLGACMPGGASAASAELAELPAVARHDKPMEIVVSDDGKVSSPRAAATAAAAEETGGGGTDNAGTRAIIVVATIACTAVVIFVFARGYTAMRARNESTVDNSQALVSGSGSDKAGIATLRDFVSGPARDPSPDEQKGMGWRRRLSPRHVRLYSARSLDEEGRAHNSRGSNEAATSKASVVSGETMSSREIVRLDTIDIEDALNGGNDGGAGSISTARGLGGIGKSSSSTSENMSGNCLDRDPESTTPSKTTAPNSDSEEDLDTIVLHDSRANTALFVPASPSSTNTSSSNPSGGNTSGVGMTDDARMRRINNLDGGISIEIDDEESSDEQSCSVAEPTENPPQEEQSGQFSLPSSERTQSHFLSMTYGYSSESQGDASA